MNTVPPPKKGITKTRLLTASALTLGCASLVVFMLCRREPRVQLNAIANIAETDHASLRASATDEPTGQSNNQSPAANQTPRHEPAAETLEALAAHDPANALALALGEADTAVRDERLQSVLRGWATTAPDSAAGWALAQSFIDQGLAMAAVFNGANHNPEAALDLAQRLSSEHPENAGSYGSYLIFGLSQVGEYERAATFAANSPADARTDLLTAAYGYWAKQQPEKAVFAALKLDDPSKQDAAFQAAVGGWARTDPQQLTATANQFPEGHDRTLALTTGLRSWLEKDPAAAADWISQHKLSEKESSMALEE
jgi:hypothetical protein